MHHRPDPVSFRYVKLSKPLRLHRTHPPCAKFTTLTGYLYWISKHLHIVTSSCRQRINRRAWWPLHYSVDFPFGGCPQFAFLRRCRFAARLQQIFSTLLPLSRSTGGFEKLTKFAHDVSTLSTYLANVWWLQPCLFQLVT